MVIAANINVNVDIFTLYSLRWSIERLFKHLKTSGFNIENTHVIKPERFMKLLAVCGIGAAIIIKNGFIQNKHNPIAIRNKSTKPKLLFSMFTYGLDHIKYSFNFAKNKLNQLIRLILKQNVVQYSDFNLQYKL